MKVDSKLARTPQAGAIPCPFCSHPIPVTAEALLSGVGLTCSACGATLSVDRDRSADALQSLRHLQAQHDESTSPPADTPAPTRARPRRARKRR